MRVRIEAEWMDLEDRVQKCVVYAEATSTIGAIVDWLRSYEDVPSSAPSFRVHAVVEQPVFGQPKYPQICVRVAEEPEALLVGRVARAMGHHGIPPEEVEAYRREASADGYASVVSVTQQWVGLRCE